MNLLWTEEGWEDYLYRQQTDRGMVRRINALIVDIRRNRFAGIGLQGPDGRELHVSRAIMRFHSFAQQCGVSCHSTPVGRITKSSVRANCGSIYKLINKARSVINEVFDARHFR